MISDLYSHIFRLLVQSSINLQKLSWIFPRSGTGKKSQNSGIRFCHICTFRNISDELDYNTSPAFPSKVTKNLEKESSGHKFSSKSTVSEAISSRFSTSGTYLDPNSSSLVAHGIWASHEE